VRWWFNLEGLPTFRLDGEFMVDECQGVIGSIY